MRDLLILCILDSCTTCSCLVILSSAAACMELDEFVYLYVYFLSFFGTFFMKPVCVAFDLIYLLLQHLERIVGRGGVSVKGSKDRE